MPLTQLDNTNLFWYWVNERHMIYLRSKVSQLPKPWTKDPILQEYKFTNVFRQLDTGTLWLSEHFLEPHRGAPLDLLAFNICWYRMFNWTGTGGALGWCKDWPVKRIISTLSALKNEGYQIFTGAHIIHSEPGEPKIDSITKVCRHIFRARKDIVEVARDTRSLEATYTELKKHRHVGSFLAYEMVSDMRWTRLLEDAHDINTWANPGPGAMRGLSRLQMPATEKTGVDSMRTLLAQQHLLRSEQETSGWPGRYKADWTPVLEMRDIEHSLCEFDKYSRVKFGEGKPRGRYPGRGET